MIRIIRTKVLRALRKDLMEYKGDAAYQKRRGDSNAESAGRIERRALTAERELFDPVSGATWKSIAKGERANAQVVVNERLGHLREIDRLTRHNAALRDALTALGGAVIELQDHIEVNQ